MVEDARPIDISDMPDLLRLAEEVRTSNEPRVLTHKDEQIALVVPVHAAKKRPRRGKTQADYEAFRSAAGSWADVDTDKLVEEIYAMRRRSNRPPVEL